MNRADKRVWLCIGLLAANLVFIWGNSLLPGEASGALSSWVKHLLTSIFGGNRLGPEDAGLLRKLAHFAEFCTLGLCLGWLFSVKGKSRFYALMLGIGVACLDETIQIFVPGRGPGIRDVCIDATGVAAGILLLYFGQTIFKKVN